MDKLLKKLNGNIRNLPYIGKKTSERLIFALLETENKKLREIAEILEQLSQAKTVCSNCGVKSLSSPCEICNNAERDNILCIVENSKELYKRELAGIYNGKYHVLNGVISPFKSKNFDELNIQNLKERIENEHIKEIIIALSPLPEGEITIRYLIKYLSDIDIKITKMAVGIPIGQFLENADEITLKSALLGRINAKD